MRIPPDSPSFSHRGQIAALTRSVADATGNRDGIHDNETLAAGHLPQGRPSSRQPLLHRLTSHFAPGLSTRDERAQLSTFVAEREASWGAPTSTLTAADVPWFEAFRTEKAAALVRFDRHPGEVTEGYVRAAGSVDGQPIEPRDVFWQRWAPTAPPTGKVVVVSPGFQETGRNFLEQVQLLNAEGHEVVVMDHQWAGYTRGQRGAIDRGYGVARDVAAVAACAQTLVEAQGHADGEVVLFGNSMGAGPGVLGALALNDSGRLQLEGPQMPRGLNAVLQAPFLELNRSVVNRGLSALSEVPLLRDVALPSSGLPVLTRDPVAATKLAQHVVLEGVVARPQAMGAANADLTDLWKAIGEGKGPTGRVAIIHGDGDPLADVEGSRELARELGASANLIELENDSHVLSEEAGTQARVLDALRWLDAR